MLEQLHYRFGEDQAGRQIRGHAVEHAQRSYLPINTRGLTIQQHTIGRAGAVPAVEIVHQRATAAPSLPHSTNTLAHNRHKQSPSKKIYNARSRNRTSGQARLQPYDGRYAVEKKQARTCLLPFHIRSPRQRPHPRCRPRKKQRFVSTLPTKTYTVQTTIDSTHPPPMARDLPGSQNDVWASLQQPLQSPVRSSPSSGL